MAQLQEVRELLKTSRESLQHRANVVATGVGYKVAGEGKDPELSVVCSVTKKLAKTDLGRKDLIPSRLDGIPTDVKETGIIRALGPRDRQRPALGGASIGHVDITAGTLGCLVRKNDQTFILSNNHVLADSNDAQIGDAIIQPGASDGGGMPNDHIANLSEFVPIVFLNEESGCSLARLATVTLNTVASVLGSHVHFRAISTRDNLVDAAIARPLRDSDVSAEIIEIGTIAGTAEGEVGMAVKKSGRTTGFTTGEIEQVDVTSNVQYGRGRIARFSDQLMAGAMSAGGDSGSAVLDDQNRMVGLLYAGSATTTLINRVQNVFSALAISL